MRVRHLVALSSLFLGGQVLANTETVGNYTWTFSIVNGQAEIGVRDEYGNPQWQRAVEPSPTGVLSVPATLGGCPVTKLGYYALGNCGSMTSVILPNSLVEIDEYALCNSSGSFTSISIPAGVRWIGDGAFTACYSLSNITVSAANQWFASEAGALYDRAKTDILFWPRTRRIALPATLRNIRSNVFYLNTTLSGETLVFPLGVTNICNYAFGSCQLGGIELNEGLVSVGDWTFTENRALRSVKIPSTVQRVGNGVFSGCRNLTAVFFAGNAPEDVDVYFYQGVSSDLVTFVRTGSMGWSSVGSSALPDVWPNVSTWASEYQRPIRAWTTYPYVSWLVRFDIGDVAVRTGGGDLEQTVYDGSAAAAPLLYLQPGYTFDSWSKDFSCVTNSMTVSAIYRFYGRLLDRYNYTEEVNGYTWTFSVINGEAEIGVRDEYGNPQWQRAVEPSPMGALTVPATLGGCPVIRLGYCALYNCTGLTSVSLPETLVEIGDYAMGYCYSLADVTLPQGIGRIGSSAFDNCYLKALEIPAAVTNIGDQAFGACYNLRNLSVATGNACYSSDDGVLYDKMKTDLHFWPRQKRIELPQTLRNIRSNACCNNYATQGETLVFPSGVTNVGNYAFQSCQLGGVNLNEGLVSVGSGVFQYNSALRYVVIPSTVRQLRGSVFYNCTGLTSVFFKGNAPEELDTYFYQGVSSDLVTFVRPGSTGWLSAGSSQLPDVWPTSYGYSRDIRTWTTYPYVSWLVSFDIGEVATRIGGGDLEQMVYDGGAAAAPMLSCRPGYQFCGWDRAFDCIRGAQTVHALYAETGTPTVKNIVADVEPAWSRTITVEYDGLGGASAADKVARLYYLNGGEWIRIPSSLITGDFTVRNGHHVITVDADGLDLEPGEVTFKIRVVEKTGGGVTVENDDGWIEETAGVWRSRHISHTEETSLYAVVQSSGEFSFFWKTSSEGGCDRLECFVDGERVGSMDGETDWEEQVIELSGEGDHDIVWTYRKDISVSSGQDCGWVEIGASTGDLVGETPFAVTIPEPTMELNAECLEDGSVELVPGFEPATIYYTLDGSLPTTGSAVYEGPVSWKTFKKMRAIAITDEGDWSAALDGSECYRVQFDPAGGETDTTTLIRRADEPYGELPIAWRDGADFNGWTEDWGDLTGEYGVVDEESYPPRPCCGDPKDVTLVATWDMTPEDVLDPDGTLEDLGVDGSWSLRHTYDDFGYFDLAEGEWISTNRVWREYVEFEDEVTVGETNVFLSVCFSDAGTLDFGRLLAKGWGAVYFLDGEPCEIDRQQLKVLADGEHCLEMAFAVDGNNCKCCGEDEYVWVSAYVGGLRWTSAPDAVSVSFDARGGSVSPSVCEYATGTSYKSLPKPTHVSGYTFLGWFTDPAGGRKVEADDLVDFSVPTLYAHWQTTLGKALNVSGGNLSFSTSGPTGWTGLSGETHDGKAAAVCGELDWCETNVLSTTVSGKGVFSFWWRKDKDLEFLSAHVWLTVDGERMELERLRSFDCVNGWRRFEIALTTAGQHAISWAVALDSEWYGNFWAYADEFDDEPMSVRERVESFVEDDWYWYLFQGQAVTIPRVQIDEVSWKANEELTDAVRWGYSAMQARRNLPGLAAPMIAAMTSRIDKNPNDYEARVLRAVTRIKELSENDTIRTLLKRCGYDLADDWTALSGDFTPKTAPESNTAVDELAAEILPALDLILEDLDVLPLTWQGMVALTADKYPVDEDVFIDAADVALARAFAHGLKASIHLAQGYDLTLDKNKLAAEVDAATNRQHVAVSAFSGHWNQHAVSRLHGKSLVGCMRVASEGLMLVADIELPADLPAWCATAEMSGVNLQFSRRSARGVPEMLFVGLNDYDGERWSWAWGFSDSYDDGNSFSLDECLLSQTVSGNHLYLTFDLREAGVFSLNGFELERASVGWSHFSSEDPFSWRNLNLSTDGSVYDPGLTLEGILAAHSKFVSAIRDKTALASAKSELQTALGLYDTFDGIFRKRTDQVLHFFEFDPADDEKLSVVADKMHLAVDALDGVVTVDGQDLACFNHFKNTNEAHRMTLQPLFDGKVLRTLLPTFSGDMPVLSSIPDITFAGTFPDWTMENRRAWLEMIDGIWTSNSTPVDPTPVDPTPGPTPTPTPVPDPEPQTPVPVAEPADSFAAPAATTMSGALIEDNEIQGTIQLKVGKEKKGVSKVTATVITLDGKKHASKAVNVPVGAGLQLVTFTFKDLDPLTLTLGADGFVSMNGDTLVTSVDDSPIIGTAVVGLEFEKDFALKDALLDDDYLPAGLEVACTAKKWTVSKAGKLKYVKPNEKKGIAGGLQATGDNIAGLKLTYAAKTQTFKGSFKIWTFDETKKKLKSVSASVTGVVMNGVGYGEVTLKKQKIGKLTVR